MMPCQRKNDGKMASYREDNLDPSPNILDHFRKKDPENTLVTCKHCSEVVVFRNSLKNLRKHLEFKHSDLLEINEDNSDEDLNTLQNLKYIRAKIWDYFNIHDDMEKLAECTQCSQLLSYKTTSANLTEHLKRIHAVDFVKILGPVHEAEESAELDPEDMQVEKLDSEDENVDEAIQLIVNGSSRCRMKSSMAWEHFTVKDEARKLATCKLCGAICSYRASVSNLMKHARRKHGAANLGFDGNDSLPTVSRGRAIIWLYFKMLDRSSRLCQCLICHKLFRYSADNDTLRKHLAKKHHNVKIPGLGVGIEETCATTSEDFDSEVSRKRTKLNTVNKNNDTSSDEEEVTLLKKSSLDKKLDSIDYFGRYVASLLKQLPSDVANNLQVDFVKQIMITQKTLNKTQNNENETAKSKSYLKAKTLEDGDDTETNGHDPVKDE